MNRVASLGAKERQAAGSIDRNGHIVQLQWDRDAEARPRPPETARHIRASPGDPRNPGTDSTELAVQSRRMSAEQAVIVSQPGHARARQGCEPEAAGVER